MQDYRFVGATLAVARFFAGQGKPDPYSSFPKKYLYIHFYASLK